MGGLGLSVPAKVRIREVGPRDGLQIEAPISTDAKKRLLRSLIETGVSRIEATAFVSPRAVPSMADAEAIAEFVADHSGIEWSALVASRTGAERAVCAGLQNVEYVVSASDGHSVANVRRSTDAAVAAVAEVAGTIHAAGGRCEAIIATAWDCPFDGPTPIDRTVSVAVRAVELGADRLCIADTIGTASPARVVELIAAVRAELPDHSVGVHFHDTRGQGLANALAAMSVGVTDLDSSVGGLGGCPFAPGASGNVATEALVYLLDDAGVHTGVRLDAVLEAARLAGELVGHRLDSSLVRANGRARPRGRAGHDELIASRE